MREPSSCFPQGGGNRPKVTEPTPRTGSLAANDRQETIGFLLEQNVAMTEDRLIFLGGRQVKWYAVK